MFVEGRSFGRPEEERIYADAAEYGIRCRVQDLQGIVQGVNRYLKKNKIRSTGMAVRFGVVNTGYRTTEKCWYEWVMDVGEGCRSYNPAEKGGYFYFQLTPNRHLHLAEDGSAREVYLVPGREDLPCTLFFKKDLYWFFRDGQ